MVLLIIDQTLGNGYCTVDDLVKAACSTSVQILRVSAFEPDVHYGLVGEKETAC